jgi:hypothetical protein
MREKGFVKRRVRIPELQHGLIGVYWTRSNAILTPEPVKTNVSEIIQTEAEADSFMTDCVEPEEHESSVPF